MHVTPSCWLKCRRCSSSTPSRAGHGPLARTSHPRFALQGHNGARERSQCSRSTQHGKGEGTDVRRLAREGVRGLLLPLRQHQTLRRAFFPQRGFALGIRRQVPELGTLALHQQLLLGHLPQRAQKTLDDSLRWRGCEQCWRR